ncbi:MAG: helix-turn-helix domain-containing protein [Patescibacteria group bacterium]|jgi:DNA-binding MarR family transcriptional regulator
MQDELLEGLARLGFTDKEAKVFIALLAHAGASAQEVAMDSALPRATVYDILADLIGRGYATVGEGEFGRRYFPQPPEKILKLLEDQQDVIEKRLSDAVAIVPMLNVLYSPMGARPRVRYREGLHGLRQLQAEYGALEGDYIQMVGLDAFLKLHDPDRTDDYRDTLQTGQRKIRTIFVTTDPSLVPKIPGMETVVLSPGVLPIEGEMTVCGDRVAFFSYKDDIIAVEIHSAQIAGVCRETLELAWNYAKLLEEKLK